MALANATTPRQHAFQEWRKMVIAAHKQRAFLHPPWRAKFENFLADLGDPPPGTKLKRFVEDIGTMGGFVPANSYWG